MTVIETGVITRLAADREQEILPEWLELLKKAGGIATGRINESELTAQCRDFLRLLRDALAKGGVDIANAAYTLVREFLGDVSMQLLKPQTAPCGWCSGHLKLPAKLPRQSLNEPQARGSLLDRLQIKARTIVFDMEEKRVVLPSQPNSNSARHSPIHPVLDGIRKQFV